MPKINGLDESIETINNWWRNAKLYAEGSLDNKQGKEDIMSYVMETPWQVTTELDEEGFEHSIIGNVVPDGELSCTIWSAMNMREHMEFVVERVNKHDHLQEKANIGKEMFDVLIMAGLALDKDVPIEISDINETVTNMINKAGKVFKNGQ